MTWTGALAKVVEMRCVDAGWLRAFEAMRKWPILVVLCAGLWTGAQSAAAAGEPGSGTTALTAVEEQARPSFELPSLDGPAQDLARHRGRVVLVHFFATWCEPCRAEMAKLTELLARFAGRPIEVVAISVAEADGAVRRFFAGEPLPFPILLDRDRAVAKAWSIDTLPSTLVLDRRLRPRWLAAGDVDWTRADVMGILADLLNEVPSSAPSGGG